jgi:hypothetical protein
VIFVNYRQHVGRGLAPCSGLAGSSALSGEASRLAKIGDQKEKGWQRASVKKILPVAVESPVVSSIPPRTILWFETSTHTLPQPRFIRKLFRPQNSTAEPKRMTDDGPPDFP